MSSPRCRGTGANTLVAAGAVRYDVCAEESLRLIDIGRQRTKPEDVAAGRRIRRQSQAMAGEL